MVNESVLIISFFSDELSIKILPSSFVKSVYEQNEYYEKRVCIKVHNIVGRLNGSNWEFNSGHRLINNVRLFPRNSCQYTFKGLDFILVLLHY